MSGAVHPRRDRYAVIGNPVAHSLSPEIHARFARDCGQCLVYERLLAPLDGFEATVAAFREAGGRGLNVTVPFKREAAALADRPSERVRQAGAANTLGFDDDGIWADNTDGLGLVADLQGRLGIALAGARIVLLGAGGAARGVVGPLLISALVGEEQAYVLGYTVVGVIALIGAVIPFITKKPKPPQRATEAATA